jgi:hypothetical protein
LTRLFGLATAVFHLTRRFTLAAAVAADFSRWGDDGGGTATEPRGSTEAV